MPKTNKHSLTNARVAVSLESSFLGFFAHAGFINALIDSGIRPSKISGASSGSLVAAAYASGIEGSSLKALILDRKLQRAFREWGILWRAPAAFIAYIGHGLVSGKRAVKYLRSQLPIQRIEKTPNADLSIGVTNLSRKEKQLITKGDLPSFIVASCALTPILQAQKIDGEYFLDGGFSDEIPFSQWIDDPEIDIILLHRIKFSPEVKTHWSKMTNFISCWATMHEVAAKELLKLRILQAKNAGKQVIIHETVSKRPPLIASKKLASYNYQAAYEGWEQADH